MEIASITTLPRSKLLIVAQDGQVGEFDLSPYLNYPAFTPLNDEAEFSRVKNGRYFISWPCGADLSADTIEAHWKPQATCKAA